MKKNILFLSLILLLISCSKQGTLSRFENEETHIFGFGIGKSQSPGLAREKARLKAQMNLLDQIKGRSFEYAESDGIRFFTTVSKGSLSETEEVKHIDFNGNSVFMILKMPVTLERKSERAFLYENSLITSEIERTLEQQYNSAVRRLKALQYPRESRISGRLFLSNMDLEQLQTKGEYKLTFKVLILLD
jgi:hypothetical protein